MKIEHIALWTNNIEEMKNFYCKYFMCRAGDKYSNEKKGFESYFLKFEDGARLEIMKRADLTEKTKSMGNQQIGFIHMAVSVGSREKVDSLTEELRNDGFEITGEPRKTGDGYYESCISDPDGNKIEITI